MERRNGLGNIVFKIGKLFGSNKDWRKMEAHTDINKKAGTMQQR
jgi:hypothetical protein